MANRKISALDALTTLADGDLLVVADVSETGDAGNKKITKANLMVDVGAYVDDATLTLTNKTISLTSNTVSGTTAEFNTALSDDNFVTLTGSETLTNKTLTSPVMTTPTLGAATGTSLSLTADSNQIVLDSDAAAGVTTTITDSATEARVITLPDLTATLVGTNETSATDNSIARFDGTSGKLIQDTGSVATINDSGTLTTDFLRTSNAGTISIPSFSLSSDTDTGMYFPAANTVRLTAGGVASADFNTVTTGVNYFSFTPSATGNALTIASAGTDTDIGITLDTKGTGAVTIAGAAAITGTTTLATSLTGVLRADSGVVSVDTDVTDIVTAATTSAAGKVELALASEINTGTDADRAVTPDALAGSNFGRRVVQVKVFDDATAATTGNGKAIFMVPVEFNGMNLVDCEAYVTGASSSGALTIMLRNVTSAADMLSTAITIDQSELSSLTAATPPVINGSEDDVATGDQIAIDVDGAGTSAEGLGVVLSFQLP